MLLLLVSIAFATAPFVLTERGIVVEHWTTQDGLPLDHAADIELGPDGRLWLATYDGVWTWDGAAFAPLPRALQQAMGSVRTHTIRRNPADGALWVVTEDAVAIRLDGATARRFGRGEGIAGSVRGLVTHDDALWLYTDAGIYRLGEAPERVLRDVPTGRVTGLAWTDDGSTWVGFEDGVVRRAADGQLSHYDTRDGLPERILYLRGLRSGGPWVFADRASPEGSHVWNGHGFVASEGDIRGPIACSTFAAPGPAPCAPTRGGAGRWAVGWDRVERDGQLVLALTAHALAAFEGASGDLWITTAGDGLYRLRPAAVETMRSGWSKEAVTGLHQAPDGRLWAYTPDEHWWTWVGDAVARLTIAPQADHPFTDVEYLFNGPDGALMAEENSGHLVRLPALAPYTPVAVEFVPSPDPSYARASVQLAGATLLAAGDGLIEGSAEGWRAWTTPLAPATALATLPDGSVVVAVRGAGLRRMRGDAPLGPFSDDPRLTHVRHLRAEANALWVSTEADGLCLVADATAPAKRWDLRCIDRAAGLPAPGAHMSVADATGRVWVSTNRGLVVFPAEAVAAFRSGGSAPRGLVLGVAEGMPVAEANGGNDHVLVLDDDGRLHVATQGGVVTVDTRAFVIPDPPAVAIDEVNVGEDEAPTGLLALAASHAPVSVRWHASDLDWGGQLTYRVRVAGGAWSRPMADRSITLAELPAGPGEVEIEAGLAGAWGPAARLTYQRAYRLSEHPLTPLVAVLLGASVLGLGALARQRVLRQRARALEQEVARQTTQIRRQSDALAAQRDEILSQARKLEGLDELKTRMITNLHHELRTPLSLVLGPLRDAHPRESSELGLALRNAERLETLVGQLADIAHIEAGTTRLLTRRVDLGAFALHCAERYLPLARSRRISLDVGSGLTELTVFADPDLLDKALGNYVHNALKFAPEGGVVRVEVRRVYQHVRVEVHDSGPGVPEAERERIFERLYQVQRDDDRPYEGSGLGLALAREVVELHGGQLGCAAGADGGSVFWFELPFGVAHLSPDEVSTDAAVTGARGELLAPEDDDDRSTVLIVEDHPDMRAYLASTLAEGFRVVTARDGLEGLEVARRERPSVVVSDVMMPRLDGLAMTRALRADADLAGTPVVLVSAKTRAEDRAEGLALAEAWLTKPFFASELRAHVHRLARRLPSPEAPHRAPAAEDHVAGPAGDALAAADRALLERLRALLIERLSDEDLRVEELAYKVGMAERTLQRELGRILGTTPSTWIREERLSAARELLRSGSVETASEAAAAVGLSRAYFSRAYKAWCGHAPGDDLRRSASAR